MFDEATVVEEMFDPDLLDEHKVVGEQTAMAVPPHRFRAQHDNGTDPYQGAEIRDSFGELTGEHVVGVRAELVVAQRDVR